jgi:hypothetical protein
MQSRRALALGFALAAIAYLALATQALREPGLYLDAINPDYLAVRMLDPGSATTHWIMPGNLLFGRFPVMAGSLYHGSLQAYVMLPFYAALGGTIVTARLAHIAEALIVLGGVLLATRRASRSGIAAGLTGIGLALDPGFILTWRTHADIAVFPVFFLLLAMFLLLRGGRDWRVFLAGVLSGFAFWGYFIYLFAFPGLVVFVLPRRRKVLLLCLGLLVGAAPYVLGYSMLFRELGLSGGVAWLHQATDQLAIATHETIWQRVQDVGVFFVQGATGTWQEAKIWGAASPDPVQLAKCAVGLGLVLLAGRQGWRNPGFRLPALALASFLICAVVFGARLGPHHFVGPTILAYVLAGTAAATLGRRHPQLMVTLAVLVAAGNAVHSEGDLRRLAKQGGIWMFSDVVSEYPRMAAGRHDRTMHLFADWGTDIPFIFLTNGKIPAYETDDLPHALCANRTIRLVTTGDAADTRRAELLKGVPAHVDGVETLRDRHNLFRYEIATISADGC